MSLQLALALVSILILMQNKAPIWLQSSAAVVDCRSTWQGMRPETVLTWATLFPKKGKILYIKVKSPQWFFCDLQGFKHADGWPMALYMSHLLRPLCGARKTPTDLRCGDSSCGRLSRELERGIDEDKPGRWERRFGSQKSEIRNWTVTLLWIYAAVP